VPERGISDVSCYRGGQEYGDLKLDQARRTKECEWEHAWMKKVVSVPSLENVMLQLDQISPQRTECAKSRHSSHGGKRDTDRLVHVDAQSVNQKRDGKNRTAASGKSQSQPDDYAK